MQRKLDVGVEKEICSSGQDLIRRAQRLEVSVGVNGLVVNELVSVIIVDAQNEHDDDIDEHHVRKISEDRIDYVGTQRNLVTILQQDVTSVLVPLPMMIIF